MRVGLLKFPPVAARCPPVCRGVCAADSRGTVQGERGGKLQREFCDAGDPERPRGVQPPARASTPARAREAPGSAQRSPSPSAMTFRVRGQRGDQPGVAPARRGIFAAGPRCAAADEPARPPRCPRRSWARVPSGPRDAARRCPPGAHPRRRPRAQSGRQLSAEILRVRKRELVPSVGARFGERPAIGFCARPTVRWCGFETPDAPESNNQPRRAAEEGKRFAKRKRAGPLMKPNQMRITTGSSESDRGRLDRR